MSEPPPEQPTTPAEERLLLLLESLRREGELDDRALVGSVMRHVRVQSLLRELLSAVGGLTSALREALALLIASRSGGRPDPGS
ncbi:MAG: hypothetical protein H0T61_11920 [Actinobacteria bacterium]|nr:hypothetical protein [Actinomycetota bacterium]